MGWQLIQFKPTGQRMCCAPVRYPIMIALYWLQAHTLWSWPKCMGCEPINLPAPNGYNVLLGCNRSGGQLTQCPPTRSIYRQHANALRTHMSILWTACTFGSNLQLNMVLAHFDSMFGVCSGIPQAMPSILTTYVSLNSPQRGQTLSIYF